MRLTLEERLAREDWQRIAFACKQNAGGKCQICGCRFPYPYLGLQAHHNTYARLGCERPTDLTALCDACHVWNEYRRKYGDLVNVRCAEVLGIIERLKTTFAEIDEFYRQRVLHWHAVLNEVEEEVLMLQAATEAGRWNEGRRAA